jgi:hypothetical protein
MSASGQTVLFVTTITRPNRSFCDSDHGGLKAGAPGCFAESSQEYPMSHDPSFPERTLMSSKEVTVRHDANLVPDVAHARADVDQAVNLFFDALLRPPGVHYRVA